MENQRIVSLPISTSLLSRSKPVLKSKSDKPVRESIKHRLYIKLRVYTEKCKPLLALMTKENKYGNEIENHIDYEKVFDRVKWFILWISLQKGKGYQC